MSARYVFRHPKKGGHLFITTEDPSYRYEILCGHCDYPIEDEDQVVKMYTDLVARNKSVRLVILDHISSPSAILWPLKRLAAALHRMGVLVLVDGAHAPGQTPVELEALGEAGVDFYSGNLHKWGFCPRSCALLWVHPKHQVNESIIAW